MPVRVIWRHRPDIASPYPLTPTHRYWEFNRNFPRATTSQASTLNQAIYNRVYLPPNVPKNSVFFRWIPPFRAMPPNGFRLPDSMKIYLIALLTFFFVSPTLSLGNTDTITWGGDNSRTGYQPYVRLLVKTGEAFRANDS